MGLSENDRQVILNSNWVADILIAEANEAERLSQWRKTIQDNPEVDLMDEPKEIVIENARLMWRNFAGKAKQFNDAGKRNFSIALSEEQALAMIADGWNIKKKEPREEGEEPLYHFPVKVNFESNYPPRIFLITYANGKKRTQLTPGTAIAADMVEIELADVTINPYERKDADGNVTSRTAYLKTLFITVHEDPLELKYADIPDTESEAAWESEE